MVRFFSGFGTKQVCDSRENTVLEEFLREYDVSFESICVPQQVHGVAIAVLQDSPESRPISDGLITSTSHHAIGVKTADCVPILFVDKKARRIGVSHQGWKGTYERMPQKMIESLIQQGSQRENILVAIGPAIGMCCYSIDSNREKLIRDRFPVWQKEVLVSKNGKVYLNLLRLNVLLLEEAGLSRSQIDFFPFCTYCDQEHFFSYRRGKKLEDEMVHFIIIN